jgi:hypothetical protein
MRCTNVLAGVGVLALMVGVPAQQRDALTNAADALTTVRFAQHRLTLDQLNTKQLMTGRFRYRTLLEGDALRPVFEWKYDGLGVADFFASKNSAGQQKSAVKSDLLPDTVDQRIDWAAVISQVILVPGHSFAFHVFDPGTGLSHVNTRIAGRELVRVPAGTFQAIRIIYRIEKSSGSEIYQVLTNVAGPRMLLKEEFPNGAISELVSVQD